MAGSWQLLSKSLSAPATGSPRSTAVSPTTHETMYGDHRRWILEDASWRDEIAIWQDSLKRVRDGSLPSKRR